MWRDLSPIVSSFHRDRSSVLLRHRRFVQQGLSRSSGLVDVPVHGSPGPSERLDVTEHSRSDKVASVQAQVRVGHVLDVSPWQPARAAGEVSVGHDGDPHRGSLPSRQ